MNKNNFQINNNYNNFLLKNIEKIEEQNGVLFEFEHVKTKAKVLWLKNSDDNNVFAIGFKTPPFDNSGPAHILEHSVLCGSRKYPLKDPFAQILRSSITTFLNAFTYPDKTIYPLATNNKEEYNKLMDIYLDAVFYPNLLKEEKIFKQEGWRLELENINSPLKYTGVVYGEMKGVFSSPLSILQRKTSQVLFPDNLYKFESGGDPEFIPTLPYEKIKEFNSNYYHPTNSYIYFYGNLDIDEKLKLLDDNYLSNFNYNNTIRDKTKIVEQKNFEKPIEKEFYYYNSETNQNKSSFISKNYVISNTFNTTDILGFEILDEILFQMPASPLKRNLLDLEIAEDVYSTFDLEFFQPIYSIIGQNISKNNSVQFNQTIKKTLLNLIKNKIDKNLITAAVNKKEFELKENKSDFNAIGLDIYTKILTTYIHKLDGENNYNNKKNENSSFNTIKYKTDLEKIKSEIKNGYFENLIEKYLINNNHSSTIILSPKSEINPEEKERKKLEELKNSLSKIQLEKIIENTKEMNKYQQEEDKKQDIEKIKVISLKDINKTIKPYNFEEKNVNQIKTLFSKEKTNTITYMNLFFDARVIDFNKIQYLSLFTQVLEEIETKNYNFVDFSNLINTYLGDIDYHLYPIEKNKENSKNDLDLKFNISLKFLNQNIKKVELILNEIFNNIVFKKEKIREVLTKTKSNMQISFIENGHFISSVQAESKLSYNSKLNNLLFNLEYFRFIENLEKNFETNYEEIIKSFQEIYLNIFKKENLIITICTDKEDIEFIENLNLKSSILNNSDSKIINRNEYFSELNLSNLNIAVSTTSQVNYVSKSISYSNIENFEKINNIGAQKVIKTYLRYKYLWEKVRVLGGAYGSFSSLKLDSTITFTSYRDPNLKETLEVYDNFSTNILKENFDKKEIQKLIIATISSEDIPQSYESKLLTESIYYLNEISIEFRNKIREQILNFKKEDFIAQKPIFDLFFKTNNISVLGNEKKIEENKNLFDKIEKLN